MSPAGKWRVSMDTPLGTLQFHWDLVDEAGVWRGRMSGSPPISDSDLTAIKVSGNAVSFASNVQSPMGALQATFEGVINGNSLTGTCNTRFGNNAFSAVRA